MAAIAASVGITTAVLWPYLNEKDKEYRDKEFLISALILETEHNYNQMISPSIDNSFALSIYERVIRTYTGSLDETLYPKLLRIISLLTTYYDIHQRERGRLHPNNELVTEQHIHLCRELLLQFGDMIYLDNLSYSAFINKLATHENSDVAKSLINKLSNLSDESYPNLSELIVETKKISDDLISKSAKGTQIAAYRGGHREVLVDIKDIFLPQISEQIGILCSSLFN
jgi:hypothetical protein